jgi:hypothetical protein
MSFLFHSLRTIFEQFYFILYEIFLPNYWFKVIIVFFFTSILYGGVEVSGGYNNSSRFVHCDNGEKNRSF